jgi:putative endonuclease
MGLARSRGSAAEALAAAYLALVGCEVVQRNARRAGVEVDLVALDGRCQVLVEVKCRARSDYGGAAEAVDHAKRARLLRAARTMVSEGGGPVRIDVVAIDLHAEGATVRHYRNAVTE